MSGNKEQVSEIYAQIDRFAESLVRAIPDVLSISPAQAAALDALAEYVCPRFLLLVAADPGCCRDVDAVTLEMEVIVRQRPVLRFLRAKRHSGQLAQLQQKLSWAYDSFMVCLRPHHFSERWLRPQFAENHGYKY